VGSSFAMAWLSLPCTDGDGQRGAAREPAETWSLPTQACCYVDHHLFPSGSLQALSPLSLVSRGIVMTLVLGFTLQLQIQTAEK